MCQCVVGIEIHGLVEMFQCPTAAAICSHDDTQVVVRQGHAGTLSKGLAKVVLRSDPIAKVLQGCPEIHVGHRIIR